MLTRGVRLSEAIDLLDEQYQGKDGWGDVYKKTRKDWIDELKAWAGAWKERQLKWSESVAVVKSNN